MVLKMRSDGAQMVLICCYFNIRFMHLPRFEAPH